MIDVEGLVFDDDNEAKCKAHGVRLGELTEVLSNEPEFFENFAGRRASHVMLGPTYSGRLLLVPIENWGHNLWRPVTAYEPRPQQAARYRSTDEPQVERR